MGGCAHLPPGKIIDDSASDLERIDSILSTSLHDYLPAPGEWPPRIIVSPFRSTPVGLIQVLPVSSLPYFPRSLPRVEAALREAGFSDLSLQFISAGNRNFCFLTISLSPDLYYCLELCQTVKGRLALIIDDVGYTLAGNDLLLGLDYPLTVAILPRLTHSADWDRLAAEADFEVILHCPLEAVNPSLDPGPGAIGRDTPAGELASILRRNLDDLPHAVGVNNHMGSAFTTDQGAMRRLLGELKDRDLFFVDSLTISRTATPGVAEELEIACAVRDVFLDHENTKEYILRQFATLKRIALKKGSAVGIGHYRELTLEVLARELSSLSEDGLQIVPVSDLVK